MTACSSYFQQNSNLSERHRTCITAADGASAATENAANPGSRPRDWGICPRVDKRIILSELLHGL